MNTTKQPVSTAVTNLVTALSLGNGDSFTIQNRGTDTCWFGAYDSAPTHDALRSNGHQLDPGLYAVIEVDASRPVYITALQPTAVVVSAA